MGALVTDNKELYNKLYLYQYSKWRVIIVS